MNTERLKKLMLNPCIKGIPGGTAPFEMGDIGAKGWNLLSGDLDFPLAVLRQSALEHNLAWFQKLIDSQGALLAPHGKTHMSPQLYQLQEQAGAWGVTVATVFQAQVYRAHGCRRIILANQLIGKREIRYILDELHGDADLDFYCLVDSREGAARLAAELEEHPLQRPLQVLLELGISGKRCGVRDPGQALELARHIAGLSAGITLRGVAAFEGLIMLPSAEESAQQTSEFLDRLCGLAEAMAAESLFAPGTVLLSAGGSAYYDLVLERLSQSPLGGRARVVVRSGCYLFHDSILYRNLFQRIQQRSGQRLGLNGGPIPALEVWGQVLSRPEPTRAVLGIGRRDISFDADPPLPEKWFRPGEHFRPEPLAEALTVAALNDQHALVNVHAGSSLRVGDLVGCGVSHPCTTLDKWQVLMVVDDDYRVTSAVKTFF